MSFRTNPLTVLLIPPSNSPVGSAGMEKGKENRLRAGEAAGYDAGGHEAGGNALYADECLRPIIKPPFKGIWNDMNLIFHIMRRCLIKLLLLHNIRKGILPTAIKQSDNTPIKLDRRNVPVSLKIQLTLPFSGKALHPLYFPFRLCTL